MRWQKYILPVVLGVLLIIFIAYPILNVSIKSFKVDNVWSLENYLDSFSQKHISRIIWQSFALSTASAFLATTLGLVLALTVVKTRLVIKKLVLFVAFLPLVIPGFVKAVSFIFLYGRNGLITYQLLGLSWDVYSWKAVLFLQTLGLSTTAFFLIMAVMVGVDSRIEDGARNLGASEWEVFHRITFPLIRPGVVSALLLTFLLSMSDFATPSIVGGRFNTLATSSYHQLIGNYDIGMASTLSMILLFFCLIAFALYSRVQKSDDKVRVKSQRSKTKIINFRWPVQVLLYLVCGLFCLIIISIFLGVFLAAFTKHLGANFELTLEHFKILPHHGWNSTRNTIVFAAMTSLVMSIMGVIIAYLTTRMKFVGRKALDLLSMLPFAIPGTFMGVGFAITFNHPPLLLTGTWMIVIACTVTRELPLGIRSSVSVLLQQDRSIEDASVNLGASRIITFFKVIVPMARPAVLVSALYAFISTVKTLGAIIFLITPNSKVLSVDVFEATIRGDIGDAAALSVVVIAVCALGILSIGYINSREQKKSWTKKEHLKKQSAVLT